MNQAELIDSIAAETQESKITVKRVLDSLVSHVQQGVRNHGRMSVSNLGVFAYTTRAAREGRNPRTGEAVKIKASVRPTFRPSKAFREAMPSPRSVAAKAAKK